MLNRWVKALFDINTARSHDLPLSQVKKATKAFKKWSHSGWEFDDWNSWRMRDGMMCRTANDCTWLDSSLLCQDYEIDVSISQAWFGGDLVSIKGKCQCGGEMEWDDYELQCQTPRPATIALPILFLIILMGLIGCCVFCAVCCCIFKR